MIDGEPIQVDVEQTHLQDVVNTNWDLYFDKQTGHCFLRKDKSWLAAKGIKDAWLPGASLPGDVAKLPATEQYKEVSDRLRSVRFRTGTYAWRTFGLRSKRGGCFGRFLRTTDGRQAVTTPTAAARLPARTSQGGKAFAASDGDNRGFVARSGSGDFYPGETVMCIGKATAGGTSTAEASGIPFRRTT